MRLKRTVDLSHPVWIYGLLWAATLLLARAQLLVHLVPLHPTTVIMVAANIATFTVIFALLRMGGVHARQPGDDRPRALGSIRRIVPLLLAVWLLGSLLEVIVSRGVPLLWLLRGVSELDYRDFGVSTFHGFMNALYLFSLSAVFLDYLVTGRRRRLLLCGFLLLWPVVIISRGLLVWAVAQLAGVYVTLRRLRIRHVIVVGMAAVVFIVVFGWLGDFRLGIWRSGGEAPPRTAAVGVLRSLPSGFAWTYAYVTSSLNNVNQAIENLNPSYTFYYSTINLFPTIVRSVLYDQAEGRYPLPLVVPSYNTSTVYGNFLADFGVTGAIIAVAIIQVLVAIIYLSARRRASSMLLAYSVLFQGILLSVVTDTFTSLVNVMQLGLAALVGLTTPHAVSLPTRVDHGLDSTPATLPGSIRNQ